MREQGKVAHTCDPNSCGAETTAYLRSAWAIQCDPVSGKKARKDKN